MLWPTGYLAVCKVVGGPRFDSRLPHCFFFYLFYFIVVSNKMAKIVMYLYA